jgi:hypothetical protein
MPQHKIPEPPITDERTFAKISRRELLKIAPLLIAGTVAIPTATGPCVLQAFTK